MRFNPTKHHRRSIRLKGYDYASAGAYFITVCTHQRQRLFGTIVNGAMKLNEFGQIIAEEWLKSAEIRQEIELDAWVIMPDHLHGIIWLHPAPHPDPVRAQGLAPLTSPLSPLTSPHLDPHPDPVRAQGIAPLSPHPSPLSPQG